MVLIRGVESDFNIAGCIRKAFPWGKVARAQPVTDEGKGIDHYASSMEA